MSEAFASTRRFRTGWTALARAVGRGAAGPGRWRGPLLLVDPDGAHPPLAALDIACRLVPLGGILHVVAPVRLPLSVPLEAPPGEETERAAAALHQIERLAGQAGVAVSGHLCRGRTVRVMLHQIVGEVGADVVVIQAAPERLLALAEEVGPAQAVLLPDIPAGGQRN